MQPQQRLLKKSVFVAANPHMREFIKLNLRYAVKTGAATTARLKVQPVGPQPAAGQRVRQAELPDPVSVCTKMVHSRGKASGTSHPLRGAPWIFVPALSRRLAHFEQRDIRAVYNGMHFYAARVRSPTVREGFGQVTIPALPQVGLRTL